MTQNRSFAKITEILLKKLRSVIVFQNPYLNKILDVHPLSSSLNWLPTLKNPLHDNISNSCEAADKYHELTVFLYIILL